MTVSTKVTALVVDDEPSICWGFERLLAAEGFDVLTAGSAEAGLELAAKHEISLVLLDVRLPGASGLETLPRFREVTGGAPIVVMTAFGDLETAVSAVHQGATDYLTKPFKLDAAAEVCRRALRRVGAGDDNASTKSGDALPRHSPRGDSASGVSAAWDSAAEAAEPQLIGRSLAMQRVFHQIALVADSDLSVLITGETGTGKELVAAAIHRHSRRQAKPYVAVAPVAFNPSLLESELFGHVRGAFTGANEDRQGLFEVASGGTILLDEIGDLPLGSQVKLLRVLEQRRYTRVGEVTSRPCDVRILAATHRDLKSGVSEGTFREDLLYRISGVRLELPPLRERPEDIGPLVAYFLNRLGYPEADAAVDAALLKRLESRPWPGNIRELRNAVERAAVVARGRRLDISDFPETGQLGSGGLATGESSEGEPSPGDLIEAWARRQLAADDARAERGQDADGSASVFGSGDVDGGSGDGRGEAVPDETDGADEAPVPLYERFLRATEPALFRAVLESVGGSRSAAAELLGIHRATLRERMKRYRIE